MVTFLTSCFTFLYLSLVSFTEESYTNGQNLREDNQVIETYTEVSSHIEIDFLGGKSNKNRFAQKLGGFFPKKKFTTIFCIFFGNYLRARQVWVLTSARLNERPRKHVFACRRGRPRKHVWTEHYIFLVARTDIYSMNSEETDFLQAFF